MKNSRISVVWSAVRQSLKHFRRDEAGATAIEYCLIASFISIAAVGAWTTIGSGLQIKTSLVLPGLQ